MCVLQSRRTAISDDSADLGGNIEALVRGELITGIHRPSVAKSKGSSAMKSGWEGFVQATPEGIASGRLMAYGRLEG